MTAAAYTTYYNMITRGTCDLALIDSALVKKFITLDEANRLRAYWHSLNDPQAVEQLAAVSTTDRTLVVNWYNPRKAQVDVTAGNQHATADAVNRTVSLSGFATTDDTVTVTAVHDVNGTLGPVATIQAHLAPAVRTLQAEVTADRHVRVAWAAPSTGQVQVSVDGAGLHDATVLQAAAGTYTSALEWPLDSDTVVTVSVAATSDTATGPAVVGTVTVPADTTAPAPPVPDSTPVEEPAVTDETAEGVATDGSDPVA